MFKEYRGLEKEIYILAIARCITNMGAMIHPLLTMILSLKLNMNASAIATYTIVLSLVSLPMGLVGGKLADNFSKKKIIIFFDILSIIAYLICAFMKMNIFLIFLLGAASIFQNIEHPSFDSLVAENTTYKQRDSAYSLMYLMANLGLVLSPTIGGFLFKDYLYIAFLINALSILFTTILMIFFVKENKQERVNENVYELASDEPVLTYLNNNHIIIIYIVLTCLANAIYAEFNYLVPLDLAKIYGENSSSLFGTMTSINCFVVVCFTALVSRYFKKHRELTNIFIGESLIILSFMIFFLTNKNVYYCYLMVFVYTIGEILNTISSTPYLSKRIPSSHRGRIISIINVCTSLFSSMFQKVEGYVYDYFSSSICWLIVFITGLILLFVIQVLKKQDKKVYQLLNK